MRHTLLFFVISGCATVEPTSSAPPLATTAAPNLPPPLTTFDDAPFWFGRSEHSPFGPMPYGLAASRDGERLVLRGDVPDGLGMPKGAYQQFTFTPGDKTTIAFETSFTGEPVLGTMLEVSRTRDAIVFCVPPVDGGCATMTTVFTRATDGIIFETHRNETPHHRVLLVPTRP